MCTGVRACLPCNSALLCKAAATALRGRQGNSTHAVSPSQQTQQRPGMLPHVMLSSGMAGGPSPPVRRRTNSRSAPLLLVALATAWSSERPPPAAGQEGGLGAGQCV